MQALAHGSLRVANRSSLQTIWDLRKGYLRGWFASQTER